MQGSDFQDGRSLVCHWPQFEYLCDDCRSVYSGNGIWVRALFQLPENKRGQVLKPVPFWELRMMKFFYYAGRFLQVVALLATPAAIWAAEFRHSEREALSVFLGSIFVFMFGWLLSRIR
jgi:hypothetical protein